MKINLLDHDFIKKEDSVEIIIEMIKSSGYREALLIKRGYYLEFWNLPKEGPSEKKVYGLSTITSVLKGKSLFWSCKKEEAFFLAPIIITGLSYWGTDIGTIRFNGKELRILTLENLINSGEDLVLELVFLNEEKARATRGDLVYLVSPYRPDDYYMLEGLREWGKGGEN